MYYNSVAELVVWLQGNPLLLPEQVDELPTLQRSFGNPKEFVGELVRREWLTTYQSTCLSQGRRAQLVLGQYVLLKLLGEGGMGQVFKARHSLMNRLVALKLIRAELLDRDDAVQRSCARFKPPPDCRTRTS